jgi:3-mercaptopropionate dioxygenase
MSSARQRAQFKEPESNVAQTIRSSLSIAGPSRLRLESSVNRNDTRPVPGDEYVLDTPLVRAFIATVRASISAASSPEKACEAIRPRFAELLAGGDWLPAEYQAAAPRSGMGGGIGQWLLYRAKDGALSLFSLVVPPGSETPIHDHLAWGLVGLYRGTQDEEIYREANGRLELVERRALGTGDFYVLIPPLDDIHRVRTTSAETSVSIHLLTNDTGCVWRHAYDPASGNPMPFRSGYVNVACDEEAEHPQSRERIPPVTRA